MLLMFIGCTTSLDEPDSPMVQKEQQGRFITSEEACRIAERAFVDFGFEKVSRSSRSSIARLYHSRIPASRSMMNDSTFFVVEFIEGGFVIVAAPRNADPKVLAIAESGVFSEEDNPNLQFYMDWAVEDLLSRTPSSGMVRPPLFDSIRIPFTDSTITLNERLIKTKWGQWYPYNLFCPSDSDVLGRNCPVGCVPVAMGQIFSYHKRPLVYNGDELRWDKMTADPEALNLPYDIQTEIALLLRDCADAANVLFGPTVSTAYIKDAVKAMHEFGYTSATETGDLQQALRSIIEDGPIFMSGSNTKQGAVTENVFSHIAHAWVVDAAKIVTNFDVKICYNADTIHVPMSTNVYFDINWGYKGKSDGFYQVLDSIKMDSMAFKSFRYIVDIEYK